MSELKCCPFCGGEAKLTYFGAAQIPFYKIACAECGCTQESSIHRESVINAWNTRKPMANIVEKLEEEKCKNVTYKDRYAQGWNNGTANAIYIVKQEINNGLE